MNVQFGAAHHPQFGESPTQRISRLVDLRCKEYFSRPENQPGRQGDRVELSAPARTPGKPKTKQRHPLDFNHLFKP